MPNTDQVILVNEQDEVIGSMDKLEAHRGESKLHRASSVFLFKRNSQGEVEVLIQKRSDKKIVGAGEWANTVCGNLRPGESYEDCARRRLEEELGIADTTIGLQDINTFRYFAECNPTYSENEIVHIFAGRFEGEVVPEADEVAEYRWVDFKEAQGLKILEKRFKWTPWFQIFMSSKDLKVDLEEYVSKK